MKKSKSHKFRIYIVDDERFNLLLINRKLKKSINCSTELFTNVRDCLEAIAFEKPDLVLCDLYLTTGEQESKNGDTLLKAIQEYEPEIPVIMYSYLPDFESKMSLIAKGASDFVTRDGNFLGNLVRSVRYHLITARANLKERRLGIAYLFTLLCVSVLTMLAVFQPEVGIDFLDIIVVWGIGLIFFFAYVVSERKSILRTNHQGDHPEHKSGA